MIATIDAVGASTIRRLAGLRVVACATRRRSAIAVVGLALAAAGCASFGPRIEPPTVTVLDVRLDRLESADAWFVANVELSNPNDREVALDALDATLTIEEQPVANAALVRPVTLPPLGKANAEIAARTGVDHLLRAIASAMRRLGSDRGPILAPSLRYSLEGTARLQGGLRVPFRRSGELGARPGRTS